LHCDDLRGLIISPEALQSLKKAAWCSQGSPLLSRRCCHDLFDPLTTLLQHWHTSITILSMNEGEKHSQHIHLQTS
jgi:hypothetical protein